MEQSKNSKIISILVILLIFISEDILVFGTLNNPSITSIRYVVQLSFFMYILFFFRPNNFNNKNLILGTFFIANVFFSAAVNQDFRIGYVFFSFLFILCIFVKALISTKNVLGLLYKSMVIISAWSLVLYILKLILPEIFFAFPIIRNVANTEFYFGFLSNVVIDTGGFFRNYGPFREPGVFQMFIILALMYGLFIKKDPDLKSIIILLLALFTTFSTTAYISVVILFLAFFLESRQDTKVFNTLIISFFLLSFLYMSIFTDVLYHEGYGSVFGKMFGAYESASMNARSASVWVNLHLLTDNLFFGKGITCVEESFSVLAYNMFGFRVRDNTNGILIMFARFGLLFGFIYLYRIVSFCFKYFSKRLLVKILLSVVIIVLYFGETTSYSFLFTFILFDDNEIKREVFYEHC